ncbi:MAG: hypothetical protein K8T25_13580 [Planctomycetia bacterium]|nr:hypothetical protein [Planctomycetia bacterium]
MPVDRYGSMLPAAETRRPAIAPAPPVAPPSTPPSKSDLFDRDLLNREFSNTRPGQASVKQVADRPVLKPQSAQVPGTLTRDPSVRPVFAERMDEVRPAVQANLGATSAAASKEAAEPARPWFALTITLLALFASLGGNVFLGWVAHDSRKSYRRQLEDAR